MQKEEEEGWTRKKGADKLLEVQKYAGGEK